MPRDMQQIQKAMMGAWDFHAVARSALPAQSHMQAFNSFYGHLRPDLLLTDFPPEAMPEKFKHEIKWPDINKRTGSPSPRPGA